MWMMFEIEDFHTASRESVSAGEREHSRAQLDSPLPHPFPRVQGLSSVRLEFPRHFEMITEILKFFQRFHDD